MSSGRKWLLTGFLVFVVVLIILTWGSIGSAALTLGLILGGIFTALKKSLNRDPEDYFSES
nr:hypothetical protein [Oscillospiraceae bacterium]